VCFSQKVVPWSQKVALPKEMTVFREILPEISAALRRISRKFLTISSKFEEIWRILRILETISENWAAKNSGTPMPLLGRSLEMFRKIQHFAQNWVFLPIYPGFPLYELRQ
jgi:hypothetical protein